MATLEENRNKIDNIDDKIMKLLETRFHLVNNISKIKKQNVLETKDESRENDILSKTYGYNYQPAIKNVYQSILKVSKDYQNQQSYLLGGDTSYSLSPFIHHSFGNDYYECLPNYSLSKLFSTKAISYKAINITNPYKNDCYKEVIKRNLTIDQKAKETNVVNLLINNHKNIVAYNTDYYGFKALLSFYHIDLTNQHVLILGNGSTSKTVKAVLEDLRVENIDVACRNIRHRYEILLSDCHFELYDVIINTTSYGVSSNLVTEPLIDLSPYKNIKVIIDVNYAPLRSNLALTIPKETLFYNGLYMLIEQARLAEELIQNKKIDENLNIDIMKAIYHKQQNIVLIGMPLCGKTTIGKKLSAILHKTCFDSDIILKEENLNLSKVLLTGKTISDYRSSEAEIIETLANIDGCIISTGGGVIENPNNLFLLKQKGLIFFLDTPLNLLVKRYNEYPLQDRPLLKNENDLNTLYNKRYNEYRKHADYIIDASKTNDEIITEIIGKIHEYFSHKWS